MTVDFPGAVLISSLFKVFFACLDLVDMAEFSSRHSDALSTNTFKYM